MIAFLLMSPPSLNHMYMIVKPGHALNSLTVVDERKLQLLSKKRRKKYEQTRSSDRKSIRLRKETFNRLLAFKDLHKHKDWESTIQDLLKIYPHAPANPRVAGTGA
jgi:hypothetical protein